ncbi:hypothetical protein S101258_01598 [Lactiplantibacillus plantarum subsp. plantarum]|uniref:Uncharacterized protein n=1 Tax=Lactiplantibacillus plantarum subsp. plantarum TaxID=337330 RepID=A0A2S3U641_LACPN|nr:hypothetical protein S101258_01598 [Lactiplantibacillus plantarum subsp. plantarum]
MSLLFDARLKEFSERLPDGNCVLFTSQHASLRRYFKDAPVTIVHQGEVDVQVLIKESAMMLTGLF